MPIITTCKENTMQTASELLGLAVQSYSRLPQMEPDIEKAASILTSCLKNRGSIFFCGNGGSAADSLHLAAEFLGRFKKERDAWPAIALADNICAITAIANDYGYEHVFSRQLRALGHKGDVLVGISTSGNSPNVINAFAAAAEMGIFKIALTGEKPSRLSQLADFALCVPATDTPRIQEMHITAGHILCELVENAMTEGN